MGFIEFPFIEVPKDLRKIVGEPTPGTRAYRREGTHAECGQWIEDLGLHYKGDVGISPAGVTMFVPVQRAARPQTHQGRQIDRVLLLHHPHRRHLFSAANAKSKCVLTFCCP